MAKAPIRALPTAASEAAIETPQQPETTLLQPSQGGGDEEINHLSREQVIKDTANLSGAEKIKYCLRLMGERYPSERVVFGHGPVSISMGDLREAFD